MIEERSIRLLEALEGRTETLLVMLQEERAQRQSLLVQQAELERRLAELEASRLELLEENRELDEQNRELEEHNRHLHECLAGNEHAAGFARPLRRSQGLAALIGHRAAPSTRPANPQADPEPALQEETAAERAPEPAAAPAESSGDGDVSQPAQGLEKAQGDLPIGEAPSPQALLDEWYQRYSGAFFKGHTRPLKIGIHEELAAREPWPEKLVRRALACYVNLPRYLKAVREGAERIDLAGQAVGVVDAEAAEHARRKLDRLQSGQQNKPRRGGKNSGKDRGKRRGRGGGQARGQDRGQEDGQGQPLQAASPAPREPAAPASLEEKLSALVAKHNRR